MLRFDTFYRIKTGVDLGDPTTCWNPRFQDIDLRLNAAEGQYDKFDAAADEIIAAGIDRINTTFAPLLAALASEVNEMETTVNGLSLDLSTQLAEMTATMNALIAQAQALVAELEGLGTVNGGTF